MWLEHIVSVINAYQTKTPENYEGFLDLNLDLTFAKFMMELLKPSVEFLKVEEYIKKHNIVLFTDNKGFKFLRLDGYFVPDNLYLAECWAGNITFSGIDDNNNKDGPNPIKLRFYLQKTLLDEINKEYFQLISQAKVGMMEQTKLHEVLNIIIGKTDSSEKITRLLNSISDILMHDLFK